MTAVANDFDPGAFAVAWRGKLGFDIASQGRMLQDGPEAKVRLTQLRGELRGRPLAGNADLIAHAAARRERHGRADIRREHAALPRS